MAKQPTLRELIEAVELAVEDVKEQGRREQAKSLLGALKVRLFHDAN